ncbi:MAG TPA: amidohydrolase family protein [Vicinamibacterales bacterium]|nr:amidohydrolase family protein [Vicinamibacterales bacterium]
MIATGRAADRATTIVGAELADGSGAALRRAGVRFVGDRIVAVGDVKPQAGDTVVDGTGLVVAPGFIDIHNHSSTGLATDPAAETQVAQGITTVVVGPDGDSPWPIGEYLTQRRSAPSAVNVVSFVGHATVRRQVMKDDFKRAARADEIARMALLVDQGMREGAVGLSSGLEYEVGGYAETSELVELAKVVARYGGVYMSHIRDEADKTFDALKEAIAIGEGAHVAVQISHIKLGTVGVWRKSADAIALIEAARKRGVDVTADAYPYNAWQSTITVLVPDKRYDDPSSVEKALADVGGAKNVLIVRHAAHPAYEFKTLDAIAADQKRTAVEEFIQIVKDGGATVVCTSMVDEDIRAFYRQPWVMVGSDGGLANRHPRGAGTFPRVLGRYVRDQQWLTLPEAIRKMTSAPAARLRLEGRGQIKAGAIADVVLFNAKTIVDRSTFTDPAVLPTGVEKVFVAGELVWDAGKPVAARPGRVLMSGHTPVDTDAGSYRLVPNWGQLPAGIQLGEVPGMTIDAAGRIFSFNRAEPPIIEFDASGTVLKTWGEKMFVWPHGIRVDRNGFLWITDGRARDGIGQQVFKYTREGQLVMTLGKKGVSGNGPDTFNSPTDVAVAPNGDIFVSDGHVNSRIVKFSKDGTFIKAWGKRGDGPGEFNVPHTIFFDSRGRLLVGDRSNRRIQIFDQDGTFLDQWTQFGSPSGIFIAPDDTLYVVDYNDKMALFVGSAKDGSIRYRSEQVLAEGVAADAQGSIYVGETVIGHLGDTITGHAVKKLVKR